MPINESRRPKTRRVSLEQVEVKNRANEPISVKEHRDLPRDFIHAPRSHYHNTISLKTKTTNYTALKTDDVIECNGTFTVTLYKSIYQSALTIVNIGTGEITLGGQTVNDVTDMILDCNSAIDIYGNSNEWRIG